MADVELQAPPETPSGPDPLIGRVLNGRFSILETIGSGGMGKVYKAIQSPLDRVVAVKVLHPHFAGRDAGFVRRFVLEASLTSKLRHPNTVTVIDYGQTEDGIFYIAMEYLEGQTLSEILSKTGPLEWPRCVHIGQQVCRSLREAHKFGIIHRDLKPANVMLIDEADHDVVKVLDFGLVKSFTPEGQAPLVGDSQITQAGMLLGSPQYMAPEQARHHSDPRSDVYSFGILLFEMLTGRPPFQARDYLEVIVKHLKEPPPRMRAVRPDLKIPDEVEAIVQRCLQKEAAARFQSMDDVLDALRNAAMASGLSSSTESRSAFASWPSSNPGLRTRAGMATPLPGQMPGSPMTPVPISLDSESAAFRMERTVPPAIPAISGIRPVEPVAIPAPSVAPAPSLFQAEASGARRKTSSFVLLAIGGSALALSVAVWLLVRERPAPAPMPPPTAALVEKPVAPAPAPTQAPVLPAKLVRFRVASEPAGARVFTGSRDLGTTPLTFELAPAADGTATAELIFVLDGFRPLAVTAGGSGDVVLSQRLQKKAGGGSRSSETRQVSMAGRPAAAPSYESVVEETPMIAPPPPTAARPVTAPPTPATAVSTNSAAPPRATAAARMEFDQRMTAPRKLGGPDPEYTQQAIDHQAEGLMAVRCVVTLQGQVRECKVLKSVPFMDRPVVDALQRRSYAPAVLEGNPVEVYYTFLIRLTLPESAQ